MVAGLELLTLGCEAIVLLLYYWSWPCCKNFPTVSLLVRVEITGLKPWDDKNSVFASLVLLPLSTFERIFCHFLFPVPVKVARHKPLTSGCVLPLVLPLLANAERTLGHFFSTSARGDSTAQTLYLRIMSWVSCHYATATYQCCHYLWVIFSICASCGSRTQTSDHRLLRRLIYHLATTTQQFWKNNSFSVPASKTALGRVLKSQQNPNDLYLLLSVSTSASPGEQELMF